MNAAAGLRAYARAREVAAFGARLVARLAVIAGLAIAGFALTLLFSASASAGERSGDPNGTDGPNGKGRGLLGVVGGVTNTTATVTGKTLETVDTTTRTVTTTATKTVDTAVDTVTSTVGTATGAVDDTLDAVTGTVGGVVDPVLPAPEAPADVTPATETPAAKAPAAEARKAVSAADRRDDRKRAAARSEQPQPGPAGEPVTLLRSGSVAAATAPAGGHGGSPLGQQLPVAPASGATATAASADGASKNPLAILQTLVSETQLRLIGGGCTSPAAGSGIAAALPCTSPD